MSTFTPNTEGIFTDLPAETYHKAPGFSHSMSKNMEPPARLPAYLAEKREVTSAMKLGTLVHTSILEPEKPLTGLAVKPEWMSFTTREGKWWREDQQKAGLEILTQDEWATLNGTVASIRQHSLCQPLFAEGTAEVSIFKNFTLGGTLLRKSRMDWVPTGGNCLVDIKTCLDVSDDGFSKTMYEMGYYTQAAYYLDIWNDSHPLNDQKECFCFIAVEKFPPYLSRCIVLRTEAIKRGREVNLRRMQAAMECYERGFWPGYAETFTALDIPGWAHGKLVDEANKV